MLISTFLLVLWGQTTPSQQAPDQPQPGANGVAQVSYAAANSFVQRENRTLTSFALPAMDAFAYGTERTRGRVSLRAVAGRQPAVLEFFFQGVSTNEDGFARATQEDVTVYHSSRTRIQARKQIVLDSGGVRILPAKAECHTTMQIHWVEAARRAVRFAVRRRVARQQPDAEFQKSRAVARQVERQLNEQIDAPLREANSAYREKVFHPLMRRSAFPRRIETHSGPGHLQVRLLQQKPGQKPGPSRTPVLSASHDIGLALHESLVENLAECLWAGQEVHDKQILNLFKAATGNEPRPLWVHDRRPRWSFTWADKRPLSVQFRDRRVSITVRGKRVRQGDQARAISFEASATYGPRITVDGPCLERQGEVRLYLAPWAASDHAGLQNNLSDVGDDRWDSFLQWKFSGVFPPQIYFDSLAPPVGGLGDKLRQFQLVHLLSQGQWLRVGYQLKEEG